MSTVEKNSDEVSLAEGALDGEMTHSLVVGENAEVTVTIKVPAKMVARAYEDVIAQTSKEARLKGFRKGRVPREVLVRKFGAFIGEKATQSVITDAVRKTLKKIEKKPLAYSYPRLEGKETMPFDREKDFVFSISYDTTPIVKLADISTLVLKNPTVDVSSEDVMAELKNIQAKNAVLLDKKEAIGENDEVTLSYIECSEDGNALAKKQKVPLSFTVGAKEVPYGFDEAVKGLRAGTTTTIKKSFTKDDEETERAGTTTFFAIDIESVRSRELPEIDDELAQDLSEKYKTLEDLKKDIGDRLEEKAQEMLKSHNQKKIMKFLRERSTVEIPQSAVEFYFEHAWKNFVHHNGGDEQAILDSLHRENRNKQSLFLEWNDRIRESVSNEFIMEKCAEEEQVEIREEDVKQRIKSETANSGARFDEVWDYYKRGNHIERMKGKMREQRLFDILLSRANIQKEGKINFKELLENNESRKSDE